MAFPRLTKSPPRQDGADTRPKYDRDQGHGASAHRVWDSILLTGNQRRSSTLGIFQADFHGCSISINLSPHFSQGDVAHRLEANGVWVPGASIRRRVSPLLREHAILFHKKLQVWCAKASIGRVFHHFFPKTITRLAQNHVDFMVCKNSTTFVGGSTCNSCFEKPLVSPLSILRPLTRLERR